MIRVFVGCASGDDLESQAVLEYSLRKHASEPVEIVWMQQSRDPASPFCGWDTRSWVTPFSGFRWLVPHLCNFEGRAIYCDSDIIWMADAAELWNQPLMPGKSVLGKGGSQAWRFCVTLFDCAAVKPHMMPPAKLRSSPGAHQEMTRRFRNASFVQPFAGNWNCVDLENYSSINDPDIKVIHYSDISTQPSSRYARHRLAAEGRKHWYDGPIREHPRKDLVRLFDECLEAALRAGYTPEKYDAPRFGTYTKQSLKNYRGRGHAA